MKCDIIAGGESLRGFDFSTLDNYRIVLNHIYKYVPHDMVVMFDPPHKLFTEEEIAQMNNLQTLDTWGGKWTKGNKKHIYREGNLVSGANSSLILAVNIALNLGFKEIDIYGADWNIKTYAHFYDETPIDEKTKKRCISNYKVMEVMFRKLEFLQDEIITIKKPLPN